MKKVNEHQVAELYAFTRKHYVEFYDLQTELVDHLAGGIEKQWQQDPDIDFEKALKTEFKKFGVFGFMDVLEERQKALGKKYLRLIWKHLKEYFTVPKVILTLTVTALLFLVLKTINISSLWWAAIGLLLFLVYLIQLIRNRKKLMGNKHKDRKKWMFEEQINNYGSGLGIGIVPFQIVHMISLTDGNFYEWNTYALLVFSFLVTVFCFALYVMVYEIPQMAQHYLKETYPEYELVMDNG